MTEAGPTLSHFADGKTMETMKVSSSEGGTGEWAARRIFRAVKTRVRDHDRYRSYTCPTPQSVQHQE